MAFTLPELPYPYDALAPHMSQARPSNSITTNTIRPT